MIENIQYLNILLGLSLYTFISGSEQTTIQHSRPQNDLPMIQSIVEFRTQIVIHEGTLIALACKALNRSNNRRNR